MSCTPGLGWGCSLAGAPSGLGGGEGAYAGSAGPRASPLLGGCSGPWPSTLRAVEAGTSQEVSEVTGGGPSRGLWCKAEEQGRQSGGAGGCVGSAPGLLRGGSGVGVEAGCVGQGCAAHGGLWGRGAGPSPAVGHPGRGRRAPAEVPGPSAGEGEAWVSFQMTFGARWPPASSSGWSATRTAAGARPSVGWRRPVAATPAASRARQVSVGPRPGRPGTEAEARRAAW